MTMKSLGDWKEQAEKRRPSERTILGYWVRMYELASGKPCMVNFTSHTIAAFNTVISSVRNLYGVDNDEIKLIMLFSYTHDPLSFGEPTKYGDIKYLYKITSLYQTWLTEAGVSESTLSAKRQKILTTMQIESSTLLTQHLGELLGAI